MASDFVNWLGDHIYVPILFGIVILALLVLLAWFLYKKCGTYSRFDYSVLQNDMELPRKMEIERRQQANALRDEAWINCQFYMRSHPQYDNVRQLDDIGSRSDKHWFRVTEQRGKSEKILTISPVNSKMIPPFTPSTGRTLRDLLVLIKYPYLFPTTTVDFVIEQNLVVVVQPLSLRGSLKDYIYKCRFTDEFHLKYQKKSQGLKTEQIKVFGRQILEALLFLEDKGFPAHGHVHSGNIMYEKECCRLAGCENAFLGTMSRLHPIIKKKIKDDRDIDVISFGHLLYEMCTGSEIPKAHPSPNDLSQCENEQVEILNYIFENESGKYPTLQEISLQEFFKVKLPQLSQYNPAPISLSGAMKSLLRSVRKGIPIKRQMSKRRLSSTTDLNISNTSKPGKTSTPRTTPPPGAPPGAPPAPPPPPPGAPPPPVAPPPPPPGAPPPPPPPQGGTSFQTPPPSSGRSALLGSIRAGTKLKKAVTNDRSAPTV